MMKKWILGYYCWLSAAAAGGFWISADKDIKAPRLQPAYRR